MQRNSLQAVLERQVREGTQSEPKQAKPAARKQAPINDEARSGKFYRPSREGRKLIAGHFDPKIAKQLKLLAVEDETTVQALLEEALDLLFVKKGKERVTNV